TKRNIGVFADVKVSPEKIVRIASVHLVSFSLQKSEIDMFGEATLLEIDTLKKHGKNLFGKLLNTFKIRATELEDLSSFLKTNDLPLLICGDFNDTPSSYIYNELIKLNLHDAHLAGGKYLGVTYAGNLPWLRIDYIFFSKGLNAGKSRVYPISSSDHYPISFTFNLQP
ncbi:MAG: endonuclease/exonuclease/phosphatase family protein, partial [Ignavibacteria bacterium]|nr:endonuclease/exonuclease/phosphatase family protein [Ignavibacteria bacterium]